ncbi:hypothetical protein, partial [Paenibacillus alginolyticus]|uniref:hypothetical protein n=1 Tax=Paenibacillus alginolyticus TaxID=59839 RepID=UPI002DBCA002
KRTSRSLPAQQLHIQRIIRDLEVADCARRQVNNGHAVPTGIGISNAACEVGVTTICAAGDHLVHPGERDDFLGISSYVEHG